MTTEYFTINGWDRAERPGDWRCRSCDGMTTTLGWHDAPARRHHAPRCPNQRDWHTEALARELGATLGAKLLQMAKDGLYRGPHSGMSTTTYSADESLTVDKIMKALRAAEEAAPPPFKDWDPLGIRGLRLPPSDMKLGGMPVYEMKPVPKIQVRDVKLYPGKFIPHSVSERLPLAELEPFSIFTPEKRAEINGWLRETFGYRDPPLGRDKAVVTPYGIFLTTAQLYAIKRDAASIICHLSGA